MYPKGNLFIPASHGRLEAIIKEPTEDTRAGSPRSDITQAGSLRSGRGVAVVCHPHPLGGGTMHNKVVFRAAAALVDAGLTTIRFNFRGVGGSTGEHSDVEGGKEDVCDVLDYLSANYPGEDITLAGFSFGSRTGMEVGMLDDRVARLISIGTPVDKYGDYDFLAAVKKPILFVHGDSDEFGAVTSLRRLTDQIPHAEVVVFENCGHFFDDHLDGLRDAIRDWASRKIET